MIHPSVWKDRWHAARLIQQRDLRAILLGKTVYIVLALAILAAVLLLRNYLNFVQDNGLLVLSGAFNFPLFTLIFVSAIFLALSSVTTIARERDQGLLEALFYGPVDVPAYVVGKYLAQMLVYLVMVLIYALCFAIYAALTNFTFPSSLGWVVLLSLTVVSDVIAFGIFLSAWSRDVRTALVTLLGVILLLGVIQFGRELLAAVPISNRYYNPVLFLQNILAELNHLGQWLSPFSYLFNGMEALRRDVWRDFWLALLAALAFLLLFLALSVITLSRRGVRR